LEEAADEIERRLHETGRKEISSQEIGEMVIEQLRQLDQVAFVRFASVYTHRPLFTSNKHALKHFVAVEGLAPFVLFNDQQLQFFDLLVSGVSPMTGQTLAPPFDTFSVANGP
jgi:hypothetical protein